MYWRFAKTRADCQLRDIEVRTIKKRFLVRPNNDEQEKVLRFIDARPQISGEDANDIELPLSDKHGFVSVTFPGGYVSEGTSIHLLSDLHIFHFNETRREFPKATLVHGASIKTANGYTLIVGEKAAGKTTLMLRLAIAGAQVVGDEHFLLAADCSIPRPRTLRVKEGTLNFLPDRYAKIIRQCASVGDWYGSRIFSVPPDQFGNLWVLGSAPVCNVVIIRSNHGGRSKIRSKSRDFLLERLLENAILPSGDRLCGFIRLRQLCQSCNGWELSLGDLDEAEDLIYRMMQH